MLSALDDLREQAHRAFEDLDDTGNKVASALRAEHLDQAEFAAIFDEPLARLGTLRDDFAKAVANTHETLTPAQRSRLSDLIESGVTRWGHGMSHAC
jgi:hypothetical protein